MGGDLWYHETYWHEDPATALKTLQARFMAENYDLSALLPQHLANARRAVALTEAEDDRYGVLDIYRSEVRLLERLCGQPIPQDFEGQVEILRKINANSGQGIGNVLDVTGISERRSGDTARPLRESDIIRLAGTGQPTREEAHEVIGKISEELRRGECVCFPIYDSREQDRPTGWYFVGRTWD
jgi:predicted transcriptional regulator